MSLKVKGGVAGKVQAIQGMSKGSPVHGSSTKMNNGVAAKSKTGTMTAKSKKKKVIVNTLLAMMRKGTKHPSNSGN